MTRKTYFIKSFAIIALITGMLASAANAQKDVGIAAIVGDSAISTIDLQERIRIAIFASNLPKGQGFEEKLLPQILRNLIDEKLYMKEAAALNIELTPDEISRVVADIEKRNSIQPGKFNEFMKQNGLSSSAMMDQIRSQLTWGKVISKKVRPQITVSDKELDEKIEHISKQSGIEEVNISEILLTKDSDKEDKKIRDIAGKLVGQLRQDGDFSKVAKQFSKAATAENGGEVGWIRMGQLPDTVISSLKNMSAGEISNPIKLPEGYTIIRINERRALVNVSNENSTIGIKRALVKIAQNTPAETVKSLEENIQKKSEPVKSCDDFDSFSKSINSAISPQMVMTKLSELSQDIGRAVGNLKTGEVSQPLHMDNGLNVFMVCKRPETTPELALTNKIRESLLMKKLETQANSYLRDLRRGAFIEVRI